MFPRDFVRSHREREKVSQSLAKQKRLKHSMRCDSFDAGIHVPVPLQPLRGRGNSICIHLKPPDLQRAEVEPNLARERV